MIRYRVVKEEDRFYPEFNKGILTLFRWRRFFYTKESEFDDYVYVRNFSTEDQAWDFIRSKKEAPVFSRYDSVRDE